MFVHHVFFWLKNPESAEEKAKLLAGIKSLEDIKSLRTFHVGTPASTDRPVIERGYSFSLLTTFDDQEQHDRYQVDPLHKQFINDNNTLWSKVLIFDSEDA